MNLLATPPSPTATDHFRAAGAVPQKTPLQQKAFEKAQEFEAVFLTTFVEQMFSGLETDGLFGGGHAEETYRSLLSQEYGRSIAESGGIGITDQVYSEILKAQEASIR